MALKIAFQKSAVMGGADSCFVNQFNLIEDIVIARSMIRFIEPVGGP